MTFIMGLLMLFPGRKVQTIRTPTKSQSSSDEASTETEIQDCETKPQERKLFGIEHYKWWIVMFEISIVNQMFICPYFWTTLWPMIPSEEEGRELLRTPRRKLSLIMDHTVPLALLMLEFSVNTIPLCSRHIGALLGVYLCYIITNFCFAVFGPKPIYPTIPWNNFESIVIAAAIGLVVVSIFKFLIWINYYKLKHLS